MRSQLFSFQRAAWRDGNPLIRLLLALAAALWFASAAGAQTVTRYTNSTDSAVNAINEAATPCSNTFKRTFSVGSNYTISDVNIAVLLAHTYRGDLVMYLRSPAGTRIQLTNGANAGAAQNFNGTFDDEAGTAITSYTANAAATATTVVPPYATSFSPSSSLTAFDGQSSSGTWTLEICDQYGGDSGTFYQADLYLTQAPASYADLSLGMTASTTSPATGSNVTYTLTVTNAGGSPGTASGVTVASLLPAGLTYVSHSGAGSYNSATGGWAVGSLTPGQSRTLSLVAAVNVGAGTVLAHTAEISASSVADLDSTPGNGSTVEDDYASSTITVPGSRSAGIAPMLTCPNGSSLFDWDSQTWSAGSTTNSYTLAGFGSVGFNITNPGLFLNNATYGGQSPARTNAITGGLPTPQFALIQLVDLPSRNSLVTTTIALGNTAAAAQFTIFDVDYAANQFADKVTVTGRLNGATVLPTLTNGIANYVVGNSAYGDALSTDTQPNGNLVVTFAAPIDTITLEYGDHALAPGDPGQQGIEIHDITLCRPTASIGVTKVSAVISDPVNLTTSPKAIPGAVMEYCILITNTGTATLTNVVATDPLPATVSFVPGSMTSGASCVAATVAEDDNAAGADESDPFGASMTGSTLSATAASLPGSTAFAIKFRVVVN
ncbi:proprotein convertase P-domain-containing protein [Novosphingobium sp.]|uniref:proprotein convertase P-domain-containing protein n=1 Tax=Novosphingobium sp. TaxID=1874826 RepID=UPI002734441A|nr:proprotein convertase P-domain-containing protein [Novosphingobium sp.]MDP3905666.1 proprotein convertase P-domain-containing protein [Novosphingobium sp.]